MHNKEQSILIIGINFYPEPTGIGKYTSEFAFSLVEKGFVVSVITAFPYYPQWKIFKGYKSRWYKKEIINGASVTRCPLYVPVSLTGLNRMLQDFSFFITAFGSLFAKMLSGKSYDLVFIASPSFMSGFLGLVYKFFYRKTKFVYHIQDLQVDAAEELGMIKSKVLINILKWGEGLILKGADCVTTISGGMEKRISAKPYKIKQQYLFPNWVDFDNIYKKVPDKTVLSQLGFPLDKKLVFYSGAVGEKQGLEMVVEAAKLATKKLPDFIFLIAGSGPYAEILKQKTAEEKLTNLFFIDLQPTVIFNELLNYAFLHLIIQKDKASDLLLPSKLTNILAVGGIAIVTASPGTTLFDIINSNKLGKVIEPENLDTFWNALEEINAGQAAMEELKQNALEYAARYLEKDSIINGFINEMNLVKQSKAKQLAV
jgi:colanic acid biosynthesis glycosyl transferase WcaI